MNALCSYRSDISLCMILRHAVGLKELEHSLNVTNTCSEMAREFARSYFHRERLEYNEEIDW